MAGYSITAAADPVDFTPVIGAMQAMKSLPGQANQVTQAVQAANFGPFALSGTCSYGGSWYTLGINPNSLAWTSPQDFRWVQGMLSAYYSNISSLALSYPAQFQPVAQWLQNTLPQMAQKFSDTSKAMQADVALVANSATTPAAAQQARQDITARLAALVADLNQGAAPLNQGMQQFAGYAVNFNQATSALVAIQANMDAQLAADQTRTAQYAGGLECGGDDMNNAVGNVVNSVKTQFQTLSGAAQQLNVTADDVNKSLGILLGVISSLQTNYTQVLSQSQAAQIAPENILKTIDLDATAVSWDALAQSAKGLSF